ncbi:hypothetical protein LOY97_005520 [Ophidiomyces ophidiicola]|nr:hypothetical protein LOZ49_000500 [Ophidiomyces ophidiicola]KAI2141784.1 hypothetical protein LOZ29_001655 [Ophidiomyces ophidiicola]KAI2143965.1 hypothetical protein LOZ28_001593 [Ophidiomyces ophidiicola]KAI2218711.1 hypothetical protein LOZ15_003064 [Ophidiomyces ophidiicola]KAI2354885.1 hypothetical protein LOY92_001307 [Ophidiomyces ophidiicola]
MFSAQKIAEFQPAIREKVEKLCQKLSEYRDGKPVPLNRAWMALTTDIITEYAFANSYDQLDSPNFQDTLHEALVAIYVTGHFALHFSIVFPILDALPEWLVLKMQPALASVVGLRKDLARRVDDIRSGVNASYKKVKHRTIFHEVLNSDLPDDQKSNTRLGDEAQLIVAAGLITTSWALSVASFHIINNPHIQEKLRAELAGIQTPFEWHDLEKSPYLKGCVHEAIRLSHGITTRNPRLAPDSKLVYRDWVIPPNTAVSMTNVDTLMNPKIFPDPQQFIPERWVNDPNLERYFVPFGKGSRQCMGINLAMAELYIAIAMVFTRFSFELYDTTHSDVIMEHAYLVPYPRWDSKGIRARVCSDSDLSPNPGRETGGGSCLITCRTHLTHLNFSVFSDIEAIEVDKAFLTITVGCYSIQVRVMDGSGEFSAETAGRKPAPPFNPAETNMTLPQFYTHPEADVLTPLLQAHLPQSGPLLRRIQYSILHRSPTACYLATFPYSAAEYDAPSPWLAAYIDLHAWPETQVWVYSSLEAKSTILHGEESVLSARGSDIDQSRDQIIGLLSHCITEALPAFLASGKVPKDWAQNSGHHAKSVPPNPPTALLFGSVHSGLVKLLAEASTQAKLSPPSKYHIAFKERCVKYSFPRSIYDPAVNKPSIMLPEGYRFCSRNGSTGFQPYQYDFIRSRSYIIRPKYALQRMASAVLYHDSPNNSGGRGFEEQDNTSELPIGWAFLGYDGSLVSLHVEVEHRGQGLAAFLAKSVMQQGMLDERRFWLAGEHDREQGWVFADVVSENHASRRLMEKMGGDMVWTVSWVLVLPCSCKKCIFCEGTAGRENQE